MVPVVSTLNGGAPAALLDGSGDSCGVTYFSERGFAPGAEGAVGLGAFLRRSSPSTRPAGLSMCSAAM